MSDNNSNRAEVKINLVYKDFDDNIVLIEGGAPLFVRTHNGGC